MTNIVQAPIEDIAEKITPVAVEVTGLGGDEQLVDFNKIIQDSLRKVHASLEKTKAIIRCDNLPHLEASEMDLRQLCDHLIDLILQHPPQKSKLFLYVKSNKTESNVVASQVKGGPHLYEICFHTNSCNEPLWQTFNQVQLTQCETICKTNKGTFTCAFGNADCLFKVTLPGKLY